jgi:hypothetical protein
MIKPRSSTNSIFEQWLCAGIVLLFLYFFGTLANKYTTLNSFIVSTSDKTNPEIVKNEPKFVPAPSDEEEFFKSLEPVSNDKLALRETPAIEVDIRQWYQKKANSIQKILELRKDDMTPEQIASVQATIEYYRELEYLNCTECKLSNKK